MRQQASGHDFATILPDSHLGDIMPDHLLLSERERLLEAALMDYVERFGPTDKARAALVAPRPDPALTGAPLRH